MNKFCIVYIFKRKLTMNFSLFFNKVFQINFRKTFYVNSHEKKFVLEGIQDNSRSRRYIKFASESLLQEYYWWDEESLKRLKPAKINFSNFLMVKVLSNFSFQKLKQKLFQILYRNAPQRKYNLIFAFKIWFGLATIEKGKYFDI